MPHVMRKGGERERNGSCCGERTYARLLVVVQPVLGQNEPPPEASVQRHPRNRESETKNTHGSTTTPVHSYRFQFLTRPPCLVSHPSFEGVSYRLNEKNPTDCRTVRHTPLL
jgi:hypothetical protein